MNGPVPILGAQSVPALLNVTGISVDGRVEPLSFRNALIVALAHAVLTRESSTLAPSGHLGRLVVNLADAILAAAAAPSSAQASPAVDGAAVQGG